MTNRRNTPSRCSAWLLAVLLSVEIPALATADTAPHSIALQLIGDIALPGRSSRYDYQSYDTTRHLLFIAHLGDGTVTVFNTQSQTVITDIPAVSGVHGVLAVPALGKVYASATRRDAVVVINTDTLMQEATIDTGRFPDGLAYAPDAHKLYVSDQWGKTNTVIDTRTHQRVATIPLGGEAGNTQYDPMSGHIFVNVQTRC